MQNKRRLAKLSKKEAGKNIFCYNFRMLKSLEVSGFKSFAKKSTLGFNARVTSIVGPNGSGKSNVAEAFRFVLGEQSMKSLRGKRGEDLIWNGSQEVARSNRAFVKLVFDNSQKIFAMDFDEVSIEREVSRDGENEYSINGSKVRLRDVVELLAQAHIGASGHHIISQGEADRILTSSIKERREMIEEALGLKIYQYKKEESQRKLEKTRLNQAQVESLRTEIAPHLRFLKKQVEKFEKAEDLRTKLVSFYKEYLKREKLYLSEAKENFKKEKEPLELKLAELEKDMSEAKRALAVSSSKDEKSESLIRIETEMEEVRRSKESAERELGRLEGEISSNQRSIDRTLELARSEEGKTIKIKEVESLAEEIFLLSDISAVFTKIKEFLGRFRDQIDTGLVDEIQKRNTTLLEQKKGIESGLLSQGQKLAELSLSYKHIRESIEKEQETGRDAERVMFRISAEESEVRSKLEILREHEHQLVSQEEEFKRQVQEGGALLGQAIIGYENVILDEEAPFAKAPREELRRELEKMKIRLEELGGAGGAEVTKEYRDVSERDEFLARELLDLEKSAESLGILIKDLEERLNTEFKIGVEKINKSFNEFFGLMFGGGEARLDVVKSKKAQVRRPEEEELIDTPEEESEEGLDISVSLPRKRIKSLEMLSGGERALTSIALIFAVSQVNPPPFIILDETDAALDEANSKKYGDMIESLSKYSQLILITHNRETMSRAGIIYGITMGSDGVSRLLSIAFDEAVAVAK